MTIDDEISINIIPDEVANVEGAAEVVKTEAPKIEVKADPAVQDLMAQYKDLETRAAEQERRRIEAEREAARHKREAESANKRATSSHLDTITTALSAAQEDAERAKRDIRVAKAAGDIDAEVEAQDRLAKARSTEMRLDEAKSDMEARAKAPKRETEEVKSTDPVEIFAANRTPPTAAWVRAHPEYVRSEKGLKKLTAADAVAQAEDLIPDTPEYFARVEEYLGIGKKAADPTEAAQVTTQQQKRSPAPPVAPGAAVSTNGGGSSPTVSLTAREAAAAQDGTHIWNYSDPSGKFKKGDPIGLQEFARRKLKLQQQGAYDRSFTEG
jgi:hypothetical protein